MNVSKSQARRIASQTDTVDVPLLISELAMANGHIEWHRVELAKQIEMTNTLGAEVERLQAELEKERRLHGMARSTISSRTAEVERLQAIATAILKLHSPFKIFEECGHDHSEDESPVAYEVDDVGMVCEDGYQYSVCVQCCTDGDFMTEECMNHDHGKDIPICETVALLTNPHLGDSNE